MTRLTVKNMVPIAAVAYRGAAYMPRASAQTEQVLYSFSGTLDGASPFGGLVRDQQENLYGTTADDCGTVFELKPANGGFTESVIWYFHGYRPRAGFVYGCDPTDSLILDASGNLYGTTREGGANRGGTVFELSPAAGGSWTEKILWNFDAYLVVSPDSLPVAGLTFDAAGNLYGTAASEARAGDCGTVFELQPNPDGSWSEAVLHGFAAPTISGTDGCNPVAGVTLDSAGNVYGTTTNGGGRRTKECPSGCGSVFELEKAAGWAEVQLAVFTGGSDGGDPRTAIVFDKAGHIYGTASGGGNGAGRSGAGVVFELANTPTGWKESVVHTFAGAPGDGSRPHGGLAAYGGNYYGTTNLGGTYNLGTVFELTHTSSGWTETVLHSFADLPAMGQIHLVV
jgi:uncharacterized repeat protein (TIGR03803 family)